MAGMAAKMVAQFLGANGINVKEIDSNTLLTGTGFEGGNITIGLSFDETDTHVHIEGFNFLSVPKDKYDVMYRLLNDCNAKYTHEKFYLNEKEGYVTVADDDIIQLDSCGQECTELILRMAAVVENAYPILMKGMWG